MGWSGSVDRMLAPIELGLKRRAERHALITANIANVDTPGYRAADISFERALTEAMLKPVKTHPAHLSGTRLTIRDSVVFSGGAMRRDGNDVNIDREMAKLAANQIQHQFLARSARGKFDKLREAITGRSN